MGIQRNGSWEERLAYTWRVFKGLKKKPTWRSKIQPVGGPKGRGTATDTHDQIRMHRPESEGRRVAGTLQPAGAPNDGSNVQFRRRSHISASYKSEGPWQQPTRGQGGGWGGGVGETDVGQRESTSQYEPHAQAHTRRTHTHTHWLAGVEVRGACWRGKTKNEPINPAVSIKGKQTRPKNTSSPPPPSTHTHIHRNRNTHKQKLTQRKWNTV